MTWGSRWFASGDRSFIDGTFRDVHAPVQRALAGATSSAVRVPVGSLRYRRPSGVRAVEQRSQDRWMQAGPERKRQEGIGRGDAVRLEVRGILRRVIASRGRRPCTARLPSTSPEAEKETKSDMGSRETRRTPWPAARCNKLAARIAEETVAVVQNHEGGTGVDEWHRRPEGTVADDFGRRRSNREWTRIGSNGGGATRTPGEAGTRRFGAARVPADVRAR
jgi:hypothetical protein